MDYHFRQCFISLLTGLNYDKRCRTTLKHKCEIHDDAHKKKILFLKLVGHCFEPGFWEMAV